MRVARGDAQPGARITPVPASTSIKRRTGAASWPLLVCACMLPAAAFAQSPPDLDVPYVTTPEHVVDAMLGLAKVTPSDNVLDLGSGDGRIVIKAAAAHGARGIGVEIDPELVKLSNENARKAGVADRAKFVEQDLFETDLTRATVITMYLLPDVNLKLRPSLLRLKPGTRIVSHDWDLGDWEPDAKVVVDVPDKKLGLKKQSTLMLWKVPARVDGAWVAGKRMRLQLAQTYQMLSGSAQLGGDSYPAVTGRVDGGRLYLCFARHDGGCQVGARGRLAGDALRIAVESADRPQPSFTVRREGAVRARPRR